MFHLHQKNNNKHSYYKTLAALLLDQGENLAISKSYLEKYDWLIEFGKYENKYVVIRKGDIYGTKEVQLGKLFSEGFKAGFEVVAKPLKGTIELNEISVSYKKGFIINNEKYSSIEDVLNYINNEI